MQELSDIFIFFLIALGCLWIGGKIREYVDSRRFWKQMQSHFEKRRKEDVALIIKALEKVHENPIVIDYLVRVFRQSNENANGQSKKD